MFYLRANELPLIIIVRELQIPHGKLHRTQNRFVFRAFAWKIVPFARARGIINVLKTLSRGILSYCGHEQNYLTDYK